MAKKDDIKSARRAFVSSRVSSTGKDSAEDRAKFRQRFDSLASTKEGRTKIQDTTGIQGIRKVLATEYGNKSNTGTKPTTPTVTATPKPVTGSYDPKVAVSATPKTTISKAVGPSISKTAVSSTKTSSGKSVLGQLYNAQASVGKQIDKITKYTRMVTNPFTYNDTPKKGDPLIPSFKDTLKILADATAVSGFGKAVKPGLTFGKNAMRATGIISASPKLKTPIAGPVNRAVSQPRSGSLSANLSRAKTTSGVKSSTKIPKKK